MICAIATAPTLRLVAADVAALRQDLAAYHALSAPRFQRRELQAPSLLDLEGLLSEERRQSVERLVLPTRGADSKAVRTAPLFGSQRRGPEGPLRQRHGEEGAKTLGHAGGVRIVEGSDLRKQGSEAVGVARPYGGELGTKAHCQAGVGVA